MVERLSPRKIVVVDLDGTLIDGNTLHLYFRAALRNSNVLEVVRMAGWLGLRALRIVSHKRMKFALLSIIKPSEKIRKTFVAYFQRLLRPNVAELLARYRQQGAVILLATAAPDLYIPWIWDEPFIATKTISNPLNTECRGFLKAQRVKDFMRDGDILEAVITDHYDDLPLLQLGANANYLVSPAPRTLRKVIAKNLNYKLL